jgi:predicted PurR-regulated permease PerM
VTSRVENPSLLYIFGSLVLIIACLYWAKAVLMPIALAVLLTFLLNPVVSALHSRGLPRTPAVLVVVVLVFSLIGGVAWTVTRQFAMLAYELPQYQQNLKDKVGDLRDLGQNSVVERVLITIKEVTSELQRARRPLPEPKTGGGAKVVPKSEPQAAGEPEAVPAADPEKPVPVVVQTPSMLWQLPSLLESLATAGLVIVLVIFMLIRYADLRGRLLYLAGHNRLTTATKALDEAGQRISRYLLMQSIINGTFGMAVGLGFFLLNVPYAILWGFLAAVLRFIPYVGPPIAAVLPSALSLAVFPGWVQPFLVIGLIVVLELASNMIMEPLLYGQSAGVSEVALLVAVAFWTWLWGAVGLVLATPLTVCIGVLGKYIPQIEFIGVLLGDEPVMESPTNYYQRLIAQDQDEAAALVEDYLKTHEPETLFDDVLIPALNAAKRDRNLGTLTEEDLQFILQATREIVEDLDIRQVQPSPSNVFTAIPSAKEVATVTVLPPMLGCPAYDAIDELALLMLQQLLDPTRYTMTIASSEMLTAEVLSIVEEQDIRLICIAALPPGPLAPIRYLCKRLRSRFPDCRIVVGRWGIQEDRDTSQTVLREAGADEVGTTLRETHNQVSQLNQLVETSTPSPTSPVL